MCQNQNQKSIVGSRSLRIFIYFLRGKTNRGGGKGAARHSNFLWDLRVEVLRVGEDGSFMGLWSSSAEQRLTM